MPTVSDTKAANRARVRLESALSGGPMMTPNYANCAHCGNSVWLRSGSP
jgi:hypothetical protein